MSLRPLIYIMWLYLTSLSTFSADTTLDLREHDWSEGSIHSLEGTWDFYWQQFISPEQFTDNQSPPIQFPVPGAWNAPPYGEHIFPGFGYATYRVNILIPENKTNLYLAIPDMASAYKLWSNGDLVAENGKIATNKASEVPAYLPKYVYLTTDTGKLELILHTSNFHYQWGGVWYPLKLTDEKGIYELREKPIIRSMLSATVLIAASLFALFIFCSRPKEKVLLYFSLLCLVMGLRRLLIDERIIYIYFGEHWVGLQALENICTYLAFPFFVSYFSHRFPVKFSSKAIYASWGLVIPLCVLALTTKVSFYTSLNVPFQIGILFFLPYIFYIYVKCLMEGRRGVKTFGFGLGIFILTVVNDILTYSYVIHTPNLSHIGILAFVIFQGIDLAKSYLHNFKKIEDMSNTLQNKNQELMQIDAFKDEFLATTSHELRTPLHGISGLAGHLLKSKKLSLNPEHQHQLELIYSTTRRLGSLVNDIVDFASIKHGTITLNKKCVDLQALTDSILSTLSPLLSGRDIHLSANIPTHARYVFADENRLQQILFNLLGNAIKFTEEGMIQVNAQKEGNRITIEILDTGTGIKPDQFDLLFEPFQQANKTTNTLYSSSGLGLPISRQLARLHGSDLRVHSENGVGTRITFSLEEAVPPRNNIEPSDIPPTPSSTPNPHFEMIGKQNTKFVPSLELSLGVEKDSSIFSQATALATVEDTLIFIVDDEEVNLTLIHAQLESSGYNVECFSSGTLLLERLEHTTPDLILLDLMMPAMSGLDVCRTVRLTYDSYELPIMMLTARYQITDIVDCLNAGANDYLIKPYHEKELLARVYSQLSARKFWYSHKENQILKKEIDHRKQLEAELSIANTRLVKALDITDECIILLTEDFQILYLNQATLTLLKTQRDNLLGSPLSSIISEETERKLKQQLSTSHHSCSLSTPDKLLGEVEIAAHPFQENNEQYFALILYKKTNTNEPEITQDLIKSLTEELSISRHKFEQIEQALKQIPSINKNIATDSPKESSQVNTLENQYRRELLIKLLRETITTWERYTHKTKADLAEESRCWRVYLDGTTAKTRTLDRYLSERTLPRNPRWQLVIRTTKYVIHHCTLTEDDHEALTEMMTALDKAFT